MPLSFLVSTEKHAWVLVFVCVLLWVSETEIKRESDCDWVWVSDSSLCESLHEARTELTAEWLALLEGIHTLHQIIKTKLPHTHTNTNPHIHETMHIKTATVPLLSLHWAKCHKNSVTYKISAPVSLPLSLSRTHPPTHTLKGLNPTEKPGSHTEPPDNSCVNHCQVSV